MSALTKQDFHLHFSFLKPIPYYLNFPYSLDCVLKMQLASYLKTLHIVSLHNSIGGLFIRDGIKKVFCLEFFFFFFTQIAQSLSVKSTSNDYMSVNLKPSVARFLF